MNEYRISEIFGGIDSDLSGTIKFTQEKEELPLTYC